MSMTVLSVSANTRARKNTSLKSVKLMARWSIVTKSIQGPLDHCICLSHLPRVLSKSVQECGHKVFNHIHNDFFESLLWNSTKLRIHDECIKKNPLDTFWSHKWALFEGTLNEWLRCIVGYIVNKIVKETREFFHKVPSGHFDGHFYNVPSMDPQDTLWSNWWALCKRTQHVPTGWWLATLFKKSQCNHNVPTG